MEIMLNGKPYTLSSSAMTIFALLDSLKITHKAVAIAVNMQVVKNVEWDSFILKSGDCVEILDFVGGG